MANLDFRALLDAAPRCYMVMDARLTILWANRAYLAATGRALDALVGRNVFDAFPSNGHDPGGEAERQLRASLDAVLDRGEPHTIALIRYAIPMPGGEFDERFWSATHTPIFDEEGRLAQILQQTDDVTALKRDATISFSSANGSDVMRRAEAVARTNLVLDAERTQLRRLVEQAPAFAAFLRGPEHVFEIANAAYLRIVGRADILGHPVRQALPELDGQPFLSILDQVYATGRAFNALSMPARLRAPDGSTLEERFLDFVFQPILDGEGQVSGIFVLGYDVSEQKRIADELAVYRDHLEEMVRSRTAELEASQQALRQSQKMEAIGQLTGGVAHDFNNLLQVLSGNLQLLQPALSAPEDLRRMSVAQGAVERGARLSAQLLAFARRQPLEPRVMHLGRLVSEMDELLRRTIGEAIEIELVIEDALWNTLADPLQVQNAVLNLAVNARDAMDDAGKLTIEAVNAVLDEAYAARHGDVEAGDYVMLAVSDTGSGMTPEVMEKVFEPFFTTKREGRGTGLGLSMVYGFVKQSQGHIKIYSEPGQGTTIRLYLPRSHEAEAVLEQPLTGPVTGGRETILVAEDDPVVREVVVDLIAGLGYTVLQAQDGESALAIARSGIAIDLLFTDVVMPGPVRSPDLARQVQALHPGAAVLFTSGYTENAIVHGGRLDAGVALLSKPYRREDLARKLRHTLNNHRQMLAGLAQQRSGAADLAVPEQPPAAPAPSARVLLVEDDPLILMDSEDLLSGYGFRVIGARDARSALRELDRHEFDVLFTDIGLPGMSGLELARQARARLPALRVVFASGYGATEAAQAVPNAVFLTKPYLGPDLRQAIRRAMDEG
ncbi:response regulator [Pseudoroseomonas globiformis]|uniref:histidine kinase n=1 Tax=Teichococcus globiformis TaxID=2307229 RepID=A0ABV7G6I0_9PROT